MIKQSESWGLRVFVKRKGTSLCYRTEKYGGLRYNLPIVTFLRLRQYVAKRKQTNKVKNQESNCVLNV